MDIFFLWTNFFNNDENNNNWEIAHKRERHLKINNFFENVVLFYSLTGNDITDLLFIFLYITYNNILLISVYIM